MKTLKLKKSEIKRIITLIPSIEKKQDQFKEYFFAKLPGLTIHIYQTGTLLLQGNENSIENFLKNINLETSNSKKTKTLNYWGGDESGVGDFFGPIILTIFLYDNLALSKLKNLNLVDSKKLQSSQIQKKAEELLKLKSNWKTKIITNEKMYEMFESGKNLKEIIAWNYLELIKEINIGKEKIFIDGFIKKTTLNRYIEKWNWKKPRPIKFIIRGENKYKGIAAASIISRYIFLQEINKIEQKFKMKILLGANIKVKEQIQKLIDEHGTHQMKKFAKVNYNYQI